jgi:hypothetical protein
MQVKEMINVIVPIKKAIRDKMGKFRGRLEGTIRRDRREVRSLNLIHQSVTLKFF